MAEAEAGLNSMISSHTMSVIDEATRTFSGWGLLLACASVVAGVFIATVRENLIKWILGNFFLLCARICCVMGDIMIFLARQFDVQGTLPRVFRRTRSVKIQGPVTYTAIRGDAHPRYLPLGQYAWGTCE